MGKSTDKVSFWEKFWTGKGTPHETDLNINEVLNVNEVKKEIEYTRQTIKEALNGKNS